MNVAEIVTVDPQDWPRCYVCDMPVELFESVLTPTSLLLIARCHGAIEQSEIPDSVWDDCDPTTMTITEAFRNET